MANYSLLATIAKRGGGIMKTEELLAQPNRFFLTPSSTMRGGIGLCLVVGVIGVGLGAAMEPSSRVWGALLFNLFFFFALALGGLAFGKMQDIVNAVWGRPIRRLHEGFGAFLPVASGLFVVFFVCVYLDLFGAGGLYKWLREPDYVQPFFGKNFWLQKEFWFWRDLLAVGLICGLGMWHLRLGLKRDKALVAGDKAGAAELGAIAMQRSRFWSAPILVVYSICFTLLCFDLLMSLDPLWFSTLWGGLVFAITMQTLMAALIIAMFAVKNTPVGELITRAQFHDVGKLFHGFSIFFAYLIYSHVLPYWYGNMPEFTVYMIHRIQAPWIYIVIGVPIVAFVLPLFVLLVKSVKWTANVMIPLAVSILVAQWFTYMLIVMPETGVSIGFPWVEVASFLTFLGLFLTSFFWFAKRNPMISIGDPMLPEAYKHH